MAEIKFSINLTILYVLLTVLGGFMIVLAMIIFVGLHSSNKITNAIQIMTMYTEKLGKATDYDGKLEVINEISKGNSFKAIGLKWDRMQLAKQSLLRHHKEMQDQSQ